MRQLSINLDELAFVLHRGAVLEMFCFLNLDTGRILSIPADRSILQVMLGFTEDAEMIQTRDMVSRLIPEGQNFLTIPDHFQQNIYQIMTEFIHSIEESSPEKVEQLTKATHEEGGYDAFSRVLKSDNYIFNRYLRYRDLFFEQSALNWLKENEIELV